MDNSKALSEGVERLVAAKRAVANAKEALKRATGHLHTLMTKDLVDLFDNADTMEHETVSGAKAKKSMWIEGSLPRENDKFPPDRNMAIRAQREAAIQWASNEGYDPNIKSTIKIAFDKGDRAAALALAAELQRSHNSAVVSVDEDIHHSTLKAIVRQRLLAGQATPVETLGITALPAVMLIKEPKETLI